MEWFSEWWNGLELFTQVMYCVALPSTLILIIQSIMIIAGFGGDGAGVNPSDTSGLGDVDVSGGDMANEVLPYLDFSVIAASGCNPDFVTWA